MAIVGAVLSIAKLTPGQESYYERSVAAGLDDYYAGRGESPGVWTGRGARALELEGLVHEGELGRLIRGHPPAHRASSSARHPKARVITIERIDPLTDERVDRDEEARAGRRLRPRLLAAEERQPAPRARRRGDPPSRERGPPVRVAGGARLPRGRGMRDPARGTERRQPRARRRVRRRRLPAPHEPGPGPAPAHARDRRQHGADARATESGGRSTASRS